MRLAKLNPGFVPAGSAISLSKAIHDGKTVFLDTLTGSTVILPPATGSGWKIRIFERLAATSNSHIVKVQNSTDVMIGGIVIGGTTTVLFPTAATSDTVTMNRTTTGGATNGGFMDFEDIAPGQISVRGSLNGSGAVATPFSATV